MEKAQALPTAGAPPVVAGTSELQTAASEAPRRGGLKELLASAPLEDVDLERPGTWAAKRLSEPFYPCLGMPGGSIFTRSHFLGETD